MTDEEALHEARERWGIEAAVHHRQADLQYGQKAYAVGVRKDYLFIMHGQGDSWEAAFAEADNFIITSFREATKAGIKIVGVSRDPMKSHDKFIGKYALKVPLVSDEDGRISEGFGTWVQKSMYGRKYMGMERATYLIGADGRVLKAWRKVKVPKHAEEVLDAARELAAA